MHSSDLPVEFDCPARIAAGPAERAVYCSACDTDLHHVSAMTRDEADALFERHAGEEICVQYTTDETGRIQFRKRRRDVLRGMLAAAAAALFAPLGSGCGSEPEPEPEPEARPTPLPRPKAAKGWKGKSKGPEYARKLREEREARKKGKELPKPDSEDVIPEAQ